MRDVLTEGELWSWVRSVMCQGADIRVDYDMGTHNGYEAYSARLDAAASARAAELYSARILPAIQAAARLGAERERERAARVCEAVADDYREREGRKFAELKTDAETGATDCAAAIRRGEEGRCD